MKVLKVIAKPFCWITRTMIGHAVTFVSHAFHYASIFWLFWLIFVRKKSQSAPVKISMWILMAILAFGVSYLHHILTEVARRRRNQITAGLAWGLVTAEPLIYLAAAHYFATKAYPASKFQLYFWGLAVCFFLYRFLLGVGWHILRKPMPGARPAPRP